MTSGEFMWGSTISVDLGWELLRPEFESHVALSFTFSPYNHEHYKSRGHFTSLWIFFFFDSLSDWCRKRMGFLLCPSVPLSVDKSPSVMCEIVTERLKRGWGDLLCAPEISASWRECFRQRLFHRRFVCRREVSGPRWLFPEAPGLPWGVACCSGRMPCVSLPALCGSRKLLWKPHFICKVEMVIQMQNASFPFLKPTNTWKQKTFS